MSIDNSNNSDKLNNIKINKEIDSSKLIFFFRNSLSNLLGTIKLNYNFYPGAQQNLNIIVQKLEELILSLYNTDYEIINGQSKNNNLKEDGKSINKKNNNEKKLFELFYLFVTINTNTTFYEIFLKFLEKFIKKLLKLDKNMINLHLLKFQNYYLLLYSSLINKKFEYIGVQSDWNATFYKSKYLSLFI